MSSLAVAQTGSVVTVNSDNVLVLNGRKVFVIGLSPGPPNNGQTPTGGDALQELRDAGALLFRINQTNNWNSQLIAYQQAALDWAAQHGMYCWLNLRELSEFAPTDTNAAAGLRNIVDTFRNHPALGLWKNYDEAWWGGISVSNLLNGYVVIKQEDTNHPVVQTHAPRGTVADLQPYNVAADMLALDIYPVTSTGSASNPPITNTQVSQVGDWTQVLSQVANGQKEYWLIEQIAFSGTTPPDHQLVFPTFVQSRFMAYQAINNGARGLMFFGGNIAATLDAQDAPLGWNWTFWTNVLKPVVQQLGDKSVLANALVAPASTLPVTMSGTTAPDVEFCVREVPPYVFILASKREGATVNVTFSGLPSWAANGEVLYESPRTVTAQNGQFTDSFAPLDVHVYRFSQSNVPPSFIVQPQSRTNSAGTTATFNALADGTGTLHYQWRKNGSNLSDIGNISGSMSPTLTLSGVSQSDAASYTIVVTGFGSITNAPPAILTVVGEQAPSITSAPQSLTNNAGTTALFNVTAGGSLPLSYQWMKNNLNLSDAGNVSGSLTPTLTLTGVTAADAANYSVLVTNALGSQTSPAATLTVVYPLPYYEPFNYAAGSNLGGQMNANYLAWADVGTSTVGPYVTVKSNSLAVPGLMPPLGNNIPFGGLGKSARLSFPTGHPVTSGTLYYSFALQVLNTDGLSSSGVFIAGFNNSTGTQANQPTVVGTRLYLHATNGGFNLGVSKNSSTATDWVWDPRTFTTNQILFIVGSYAFNSATSSDDVSKMWINPNATNFGTALEPPTTLVTSNGSDISANQIASFVFLQRATNEPPSMLADELRIGTTWASVTPFPAPVLGSLKHLGNGKFQFVYTNSTGRGYSVYASTNLINWASIG
ncbi:MAG TPA: immunoglobulin domain-containing protein, partial [Verrucomicrobiae bacterium]|nr:immunoglobulin domain-containing protein [Verrucomicrobiae bacterium]